MISKDDILASIREEHRVYKHLFTKIPDGGFDYRPTPGQRSTLDLLRYVSAIGIGGLKAMADNGNWALYGEYAARAKVMPPEEFPAAMDRQMEEIEAFFAGLTEEDFRTRELKAPTGQVAPLGRGIMESVVKWLTAYRMQLFLYAKAAGNHEITTYDCWGGVDTPKKEM